MIARAGRLLALLASLGYLLGACGRTHEGGEGSETHWLSACNATSDCQMGECLCGVCTQRCTSVRDCPGALDVCLAGSAEEPECQELVCQLSSGTDELAAPVEPPLDRRDECEGVRPFDWVRPEDARFAGELADETHVVTDGDAGFLLFGQSLPGVLRLSPEGDFQRLLPPPAFDAAARIQQLVTLPDGSLLVAGTVGESQLEHAFIGKLDLNWNLVWQQQLEPQFVERANLIALADGGAVLAAVRWLDFGVEPGDDDVLLARFDDAGQLLWEKRLSFEDTHSFAEQRGFRMLASTAQGFQLAVPTGAGVYRITGDLDGNVDVDSLLTPLPARVRTTSVEERPQMVGLEILADGGFVVATERRVTVLDAAGEPGMQFEVDQYELVTAVRFDDARAELVIAGAYTDFSVADLPGPWVRALRLDGELSWQARRPGLTFGEQGELRAGAESAPPLLDAAIDSRGNMIMTGQVGRGLEWVWVGAESCGG